MVRPTEHLQIKYSTSQRCCFALRRDAAERHQKRLGPAQVKDSGRRTPRGAVMWRAAAGFAAGVRPDAVEFWPGTGRVLCDTRGVDPKAEAMRLPLAYGSPSRRLAWPGVQHRLEQALHYWLATSRPDARPHLVPIHGLWLDDVWHFGGSPDTVYQRNLRTNDEVVVHLEDAVRAVIVEGRAAWRVPGLDEATRLAEASELKYGYAPSVKAYTSGVWAVSPRRVLAWDSIAEDATRFVFPPEG